MSDLEAIAAYTPSEWGAEYHRRTEWELLGAGSMGPGKSVVLLWEPAMQIGIEHYRCLLGDKNPIAKGEAMIMEERGVWSPELVAACKANPLRWGHSTGHALHLRRVRPMLELSIRRSHLAFKALDPGARWDEEKTTWTFSSGYKYTFGHCKDPGSWNLYQSNDYTIVCWDELTQFDEEQYTHINLRLRSSDPVLGDERFRLLKIRAMSNPAWRAGTNEESGGDFSVKDPNWVRKRFVDPHPAGGKVFKRRVVVRLKDGSEHVQTRERLYLRATIDDNPNKEFVKNYKVTLSDQPHWYVQAYLYGNWYVTLGSHYADEWNEDLHIVRPFKIPPDWKFFRAMDWGYKTWGVIGWWAMDPDENLYLIKEFSFRKMLPDRVAERAQDIERRLGLWGDGKSLITGPADNQIWQERGTVGKTIYESFKEHGIDWTHADQSKNSRYNTSLLLMDRLADHDGGTTQPGIVFFDTCNHTIRTLPSIQSDPDDPEVPLEGGDDHWHDMTRYACAFASHGLKGVPSPKRRERRGHDEDDEQRRDAELHTKALIIDLGGRRPRRGRPSRVAPSSPYQKRAA